MQELKIRPAAVAGSFYPDDKKELEIMINTFLSKAKEVKTKRNLRALIVPHAGYVYSGPVAATGYRLLATQEKRFEKIILIGPSHYAAFSGMAGPGTDFWETPIGRIKTESIVKKMETGNRKLITELPQVHAPEHCLEVQIPFIQVIFKHDVVIYPLITGEVNTKEIAGVLERNIDDKTIVIVSSDLSHYLTYEKAQRIDGLANKSIPALDTDTMEESGDACGKTGIMILMHIAKSKKWKAELLDYRNSGDTAGSKDRVVGYGCYAFFE